MSLAIANRYATVLTEAISSPGSPVSPETALEQLEAFRALLDESLELRNALVSPAVEPVRKRRIVQALGERLGLAEPVRNFLYVLTDNRRLRLLGEVIEAFQSWMDSQLGIARIAVTSARTLDEQLKAAMVEKFGRLAGRTIRAEFQADPALLGGAVVRYGSTVFDGSIRAQLEALNRSLLGEV